MKKTNILIMGLTASVVALIVYLVLQNRSRQRRIAAYRNALGGGMAYTFPEASEVFTGLNWNLILEPGVTGYEVVTLQKMLQGYDNKVIANGYFDAATTAAVQSLMGKDNTNLNEMRYQYFDMDFSDEQAQQIFDSVTPR